MKQLDMFNLKLPQLDNHQLMMLVSLPLIELLMEDYYADGQDLQHPVHFQLLLTLQDHGG